MVFLRELIQNAEDASKIQLWRDLQKRPDLYLIDSANKDDLSHLQPYDIKSEAFDSYKITVDMKKFDGDQFRVRVIDRGTGMNVDTIKQMCRVGTSYHQDKARRREIEAMPAWLRPTAGFGIGLQSVFLVAPAFTIYSRTEEKGIKVTVESRKKEGYVQIEKGEFWEEQGTCVEVVFDQLQINIPMKKSYDPFGEDSGTADTIYKDFCDNMKHWVELSWFPVDITQDCLLLKKIRNELWNDFQPGDCQQKGPFLVTQTTYEGIQVWDRRLTRCSILSLVLMHLHRSICL